MKVYIVSLAAGILVGLIYALLQVRSPAPPAVALIGLLGILIGEQLVPVAKKIVSREPVTAAWFHADCVSRITGVDPVPAQAPAPAPAVQARAADADAAPGTEGRAG